MISSRTKGLAKICVVGQVVVVTAAFWLWLPLSQRSRDLSSLNLSQYVFYNAVLVMGIVVAFLTSTNRVWFGQRSFFDCQRAASRQTAFAVFLMILLLVGERDQTISRVFLFTMLPVLYGVLVLTQRFLPPLLQKMSFGGIRVQRVLLAGSSGNVPKLHGWLRSKERHGYSIAGVMCHDRVEGSLNGIKILGSVDDLEAVIIDHDITQVILVEFPLFQNFLRHYTVVCERHGVRLMVVCDFERALRHPVTMFEDEGMRFIALRDEPLEDPLSRFSKRCLDLAVGVPVVLFILPPAILVVALLQWRYSPGPLIFRQLRSGLQNVPFAIYKFRTMHVNNPHAARQATQKDPRVYPGGRWLRKLSIDELPQFINVLQGEMSVVGPRPHMLEHNDQFAQRLQNYPVRSNVKPGITGLAQVRGFRGETKTTPELMARIESDIHYIENWSFTMDCWIILKTAMQVIIPKPKAY
jgi:putative colanic acid biosynthesis UDP-glucose lipid carrier transferase